MTGENRPRAPDGAKDPALRPGGAAATATKPTPPKTGSTAGGFDFNVFPATIKGHYRNDGPALG